MNTFIVKCSTLLLAIKFLLFFGAFMDLINAQDLPLCDTPDGKYGYCLNIKRCQNYINHIYTLYSRDELREFLQKSRCNNDQEIHICCDEIYLTADAFLAEYTKKMNQTGLKILSSQENCGSVVARLISNGENATLGEFPWMALIKYNVPSQPFLCGGSLITERFVLTAAHCLNYGYVVIGVLLGEHNLDTNPDCRKTRIRPLCMPQSETYGIEKIISHPEYKLEHIRYDIGLIKLNQDVKYKKNIRPICLPITSYSLTSHETYTVAGWGRTETGERSKILQKALIPFRERKYCQDIFRTIRIPEHHMCVGGEVQQDACKGDSGGPLFTTTTYMPSQSRFVQYGIVSAGSQDCTKQLPGLYTNITEFMPWITENLI